MNENSVMHALEARRTYKVIGSVDASLELSTHDKSEIDNLITAAGNAPVHYACDRIHLGALDSPVPWRVYKHDVIACRALMEHLITTGDATKIPNMLAAADFLFQVTWLPDAGTIKNAAAGKEEIAFDGTIRNMEHIAAASSLIQSILLVFEEIGFKTYWSSGGPLRSEAMFNRMQIPTTELLLGSVFIFPQDVGSAEVKSGSMADKRGRVEQWSRWIDHSTS